jgi:DNA-binding protein HU-beta
MNRGQLIAAVAADTGLSKKDSGRAVEAVFSAIEAALRQRDRVSLVGFGSFEVRERKPRRGRNPRTGRALQIKARRAPVFRPGKPLKAAVNS